MSHKKLRRSDRLKVIQEKVNILEKIEAGLLGYFELLPKEILNNVMMFLTVEDLSMLTICSKHFRDEVDRFRYSPLGKKHVLPCLQPTETPEEVEYFHKLGIYIKRSTCLLPTKERLKIMLQLVSNMEVNPGEGGNLRPHLLLCYGRYVHTVIAGWDEEELVLVNTYLNNLSNMPSYVKKVLDCESGSLWSTEMYVRSYYRLVYIETSSSENDKAFWLGLTLKPWPLVHRAKLLYILFGPLIKPDSDHINWWEMCENFPVSIQHLRSLAGGVNLLKMNSVGYWSDDDIVSVLEELMDHPEEWHAVNKAQLLYLCGQPTTLLYVGNKLLNGKVVEVSELFAGCLFMNFRVDHKIDWSMQLLRKLLKVTENVGDRQNLIRNIPLANEKLSVDLHEFAVVEGEREGDFLCFNEAIAVFTSYVLRQSLAHYGYRWALNDPEE